MAEQEEIAKLRKVRIHTLLDIKYTGRRVTLQCPFHNDRTPSFCLYADSSYHCFGCGANGQNVIDFIIELGYSFQEAVEELKKYI